MFNMKQVGRKIVALRKAQNMTQTELADKMNVSFQAVSNWERGNSMPDISKLPQLASVFGCSVDELLEEKSELLHSAMKDDLQEYVENNEVSREELEAAVPVLKPDQVERIANSMLLKNGDNLNIFYPYLDEDALREVAERKVQKGESIDDMLEYLDEDYLGELAMLLYEQGKPVDAYYEYMEEDQLSELARRKAQKGESIDDMLEYLDEDCVGELALILYEQGMPVDMFYEYMEEDQLGELARRKARKGESVEDMLEYLDSDFIKEIVLELMS